jgi:beta-exotoxin I transport system permease protein
MAEIQVLARDRSLSAVWSKTLRDQRRALAWWALGILLVVVMYASVFPSVRQNASQFDDYMKNLPQAVRDMMGGTDITSPAGYIQSELFSFMGPVLLLIFAIGAGARAIAGEEESGTLDLLLSTPIRRRRVVLDKFVAMAIGTLLLAGVAWVAALVVGPPFDLTIPFDRLTAASINLFLIALAFGTIALAVGAATGGKGLAIAVPAGLALLTFLLKTFASSLSWLEPYRVVSPWNYYLGHDPLRTGLHPVDPIVLAGIAVAALAVALVAFERRDLGT